MAWRPANSLVTLRNQLNAAYPNRNKASDGMIGDAAHSSTVSQHNPNAAGVVTAFDITHDPANGLDGTTLANSLITDRRTWYVIFNSRIWETGVGWQAYYGSDPHTSHVHISTNQSAALYDDGKDWQIKGGNSMQISEKAAGDFIGKFYKLLMIADDPAKPGKHADITQKDLSFWVKHWQDTGDISAFFTEIAKTNAFISPKFDLLNNEIHTKLYPEIEKLKAQSGANFKPLNQTVYVKE